MSSMILSDLDEMRKFYKVPSLDAPPQIQIRVAKRFKGKRYNASANQKRETSMAAMLFVRLGQNVETLQRTFHRCSESNINPFGYASGLIEEDFFNVSAN